jgi:excisionase family DNA binding protein
VTTTEKKTLKNLQAIMMLFTGSTSPHRVRVQTVEKAEAPPTTVLTPEQLAERWAVTTMTLRRWCKEGTLKRMPMPGRAVRFALAEVIRFEAAGMKSE